jgi:hypothetical protein
MRTQPPDDLLMELAGPRRVRQADQHAQRVKGCSFRLIEDRVFGDGVDSVVGEGETGGVGAALRRLRAYRYSEYGNADE